MKSKSIIIIFLLLACKVHAQDSPEQLANNIFDALKANNLNVIPDYRLKYEELNAFYIQNGIDTSDSKIIHYKSKYKNISANVYKNLDSIQNGFVTKMTFNRKTDTSLQERTHKKMNWEKYTINKIQVFKQEKLLNDPKSLNSTTVLISFGPKRKRFSLLFDTFKGVDNKWKLGNYVHCIKYE